MSIDPVSISAIIIAIIGAVGVFINRTHLSHIMCCKCIESDCRNNNNNNDIIIDSIDNVEISPTSSPKIIKKISYV